MPMALLCRGDLIYDRYDDTYVPNENWNDHAKLIRTTFHRRLQTRFSVQLARLIKKFHPSAVSLNDEATAFMMDSTNESIDALQTELRLLTANIVGATVYRNDKWVFAFPSTLGKGNVMRALLKACTLTSDTVLTIGDSETDLDMLDGSVSTHVGCPGNAIPRVKDVVLSAGGYVAGQEGPRGTLEVIRQYIHHP